MTTVPSSSDTQELPCSRVTQVSADPVKHMTLHDWAIHLLGRCTHGCSGRDNVLDNPHHHDPGVCITCDTLRPRPTAKE